MSTLTIQKSGVVNGGNCTYAYSNVTGLLTFSGTVELWVVYHSVSEPFSGSQAIPAANMLSSNVYVGYTFRVKGMTFLCTSTGVYTVTSAHVNGTITVDTTSTYITIKGCNLAFDYDGISGSLIATAV